MYLKFKVDPLTVTQKKFFIFWDAKFVMILSMLERIKESSAFGLIIINVNTDLFEKENRMYHKSVFIHTMYDIATKVLMIGKSLYLRSAKRTNNLKKGKRFGNANWKHFTHMVYMKKKNGYFDHTRDIRILAFI